MSDLTQEEKATNAETLTHIHNVSQLLSKAATNLLGRASKHDRSKLSGIELTTFVEKTPLLKGMKYGSEEYKQCLSEMKPALDSHYSHNNHHPEHYENGVNGMSLLTVLEMLLDWKASSLRNKSGDIRKSIEIQRERFNLSDQLCDILYATIDELELD